ncbi:MAG: LysR family transcriptional regulator [Bryobacteraceae bacterium]|jgi:DNA-binding transcriptional LysR family regulator
MEFDDVRAFVSVADTGSVSLAARNLNITQPAVTRRLQRLEASLGTTLLDRRSRPVMLTGAGQVALERCRRVLQEIREVRAAAAHGKSPSGELRIGVAHALTEITLCEPVGLVRRKFPEVALRLSSGWSRDLLKRVRAGALEAAVILLPEGESLPAEVAGREMGKERLVIVASREDRLKRRRLQDLAGAVWILNPEGCAARATLRAGLVRADIDMVVAVETYNYELQLTLVAQNRGLSIVPERILTRSRLRSRVQTVRIAGLEFPLTVWMVQRAVQTGFDPIILELGRTLVEKL